MVNRPGSVLFIFIFLHLPWHTERKRKEKSSISRDRKLSYPQIDSIVVHAVLYNRTRKWVTATLNENHSVTLPVTKFGTFSTEVRFEMLATEMS